MHSRGAGPGRLSRRRSAGHRDRGAACCAPSASASGSWPGRERRRAHRVRRPLRAGAEPPHRGHGDRGALRAALLRRDRRGAHPRRARCAHRPAHQRVHLGLPRCRWGSRPSSTRRSSCAVGLVGVVCHEHVGGPRRGSSGRSSSREPAPTSWPWCSRRRAGRRPSARCATSATRSSTRSRSVPPRCAPARRGCAPCSPSRPVALVVTRLADHSVLRQPTCVLALRVTRAPPRSGSIASQLWVRRDRAPGILSPPPPADTSTGWRFELRTRSGHPFWARISAQRLLYEGEDRAARQHRRHHAAEAGRGAPARAGHARRAHRRAQPPQPDRAGPERARSRAPLRAAVRGRDDRHRSLQAGQRRARARGR